MTVREAMRFNALLCQSTGKSRSEKINYVDEIIQLLDMESYADAIIGVPGEGNICRWPFIILKLTSHRPQYRTAQETYHSC